MRMLIQAGRPLTELTDAEITASGGEELLSAGAAYSGPLPVRPGPVRAAGVRAVLQHDRCRLRPGPAEPGVIAMAQGSTRHVEWLDQAGHRLPVPGRRTQPTSWPRMPSACWTFRCTVSFRMTFVLDSDSAALTSDSTLRFRSRDELADSLAAANLNVEEVRDAPDRPGREFVFIARRAA